MTLIDTHKRVIDYLRLSVTDQCNLQCEYCKPFGGRQRLSRKEILSYEELFKLAEISVAAGIRKIRITGGEPLVRKGVVDFCRDLAGIDGLRDLSLTTNGVLLKTQASRLFDAGIRRVNVSLDTLKPERFRAITGNDHWHAVLAGIEEAERVGFSPIKVNVVVMRGVNDDEIQHLAALTYDRPWHVRFIELMPVKHWRPARYRHHFMPVEEMLSRMPALHATKSECGNNENGPAKMYTLPRAKGRVGFIAPLTWHFCGACNRLRVTADGKIRSCLLSESESDVKTVLRDAASPFDLIRVLHQAVKQKPVGHHFIADNRINSSDGAGRGMYAIGG